MSAAAGRMAPSGDAFPEAPARAPSRSLARRIFAGTGTITVASALVSATSLLTAPLLTALLGPASYGTAALVGTLTTLVGTFALLGIDLSYARYFFGGVSQDGTAVERLCWRFVIVSSSVLSAAGVLVWVYVVAPRTGTGPALGVLVGATGMLTVVSTMAQARARLRGRYVRLAVAIVAAGAAQVAAGVALSYTWRRDAWPLLVGTVVGLAVTIAVTGTPSPRELARPSGLDGAQRWSIVRLGIPGVGSALMYWMLSSADRWLLSMHAPQDVVGSYAFGSSIGTIGLMLNSAVLMVWFPEAARVFEQERATSAADLGRLWTRMVTLLGIAWLAVAMSGGDILRLLADRRFHAAAAFIPWFAGAMFFYGVSILAATGIVLMRRTPLQAMWWGVATGVSLGLNVLLIPRFGALAAAVDMCAAFLVVALGCLWSSERLLPLRIGWGVLLPALAGIAAVGVAGAGAWHPMPLVSLGFKLPVGMAVAALCVRVVAPDWFTRALAPARAVWVRR
ncbi:MAG: hypothetical protein JWM27_1795 [Gemmatimonadetes bacterium]|nr:hypothetical protein [Gemmatimonadota bacterium]